MNNDKLILHYSACRLWNQGKYDEAISYLMGNPEEKNKSEAMVNGSRLHALIESNKLKLFETLSDKREYEVYRRVELNQFFDYAGTIDMLDLGDEVIIYDWKSGVTDILSFPKMQVYCYSLLVPEAKEARIVKINEVDGLIVVENYVIYKLTESKRELARNYLETTGSDIIQYLRKETSDE